MKICIMGAGSIGCYIGGRLAAAGGDVTFIGRARSGDTLQKYGLRLTDYKGAALVVTPQQVTFSTTTDCAAQADLVLVTVKSASTAQAAEALATMLRPGAVVISFQNGLGNAAVLRDKLPAATVLAAMVPFNVVNRGDGVFHQGSEGDLEIETHTELERHAALFARAGLPLKRHTDMLPVQWAKLLLNLNNPVNALSNIPLKAQLAQRDYRRCLALAQHEAFALLDSAGIKPARLTPLPARWIPRLLTVPDFLFARLASKMLAIDPLARSSMWEDLAAGRLTEVEWINGEIVRLARSQGLDAPVNATLVALVHAAERGGKRQWSGTELLLRLREAIAADVRSTTAR